MLRYRSTLRYRRAFFSNPLRPIRLCSGGRRCSAAVGYLNPVYTAAVTATDNLSVFTASYYHKVNSQVEAGAKSTWNSQTGKRGRRRDPPRD